MRVAIDARMVHAHPTGIGRATINLLQGLSTVSTDDQFVALSRDSAYGWLNGLPNVSLADAPFAHLSPHVHTRLPGIIKKSGVEIAHYLYFFVPIIAPVPTVVTLFDTTYSHFPDLLPPYHRPIYKACMRHCVKHSSRIICSSQAALDDLHRFFPHPNLSDAVVIPLGVERRFTQPDGIDESAMKASLGLPDAYILYVGNHRGHKNLVSLIEAFAIVAKQTPHSLVLPAAKGPGSEITLEAVAKSPVADRIIMHPIPDSELPLIYGLADLFAFPSQNEGFGLPPLEAMACGTPVVTSNTSSLPEVVGDAGIMVDPHDINALAEAMIRVLSDSELSRNMKEKGLVRASMFSWEKTARLTLEVYENIITE